MELDLVGYWNLRKLRPAFDRWLKDENLVNHLITKIRFGEGYVDAECVGPEPKAVDGEVVREWRRLPVSTLPPRPVLDAIRTARIDGSVRPEPEGADG